MFGRTLALGLCVAAVACLATPCWSQEKPVIIYTRDNAPAAPKLDDLPLKDGITQYGITWTFDKPARVGQFVNGDYYVVGPVTIKALDPKPLYGDEVPADQLDANDKRHPENQRLRNGFMLNPPAARESRLRQRHQKLVRAVAHPETPRHHEARRFPRLHHHHADGRQDQRPVAQHLRARRGRRQPHSRRRRPHLRRRTPARQTPSAPASATAPARIYLARNLKRDLLAHRRRHQKPRPKDSTQYAGFTQKPWVGTCFFGFEQPIENMPAYGREIGRVVANAALILCTDLKPEQKEPPPHQLRPGRHRPGHHDPRRPSRLGSLRRPRQRPQTPHRLRRTPPRR